MKKNLILFISLFFSFSIFAKTVVVLDFDTEIRDYENNSVIMSDMLRSELVNTGKLDVIDRKSMQAAINEMQVQLSDYMSNENVKQLGRMLNADYLVIGHVLSLTNRSSSYTTTTNIFLNKAEKILVGNDKIEVVAQVLDVETLKVLSSSSVELNKWTDFSKYTKKMANDLVAPLAKKTSISSDIKNNIQSVSEDLFDGNWSAELLHDNIIDKYFITFDANYKVNIDVISVDKKGKKTSSKGSGRYSFNENEKILTITINALSGNVKHLKSIYWKTFVNPSKDKTVFTCIIPVSTESNSKNMKCEFYKE